MQISVTVRPLVPSRRRSISNLLCHRQTTAISPGHGRDRTIGQKLAVEKDQQTTAADSCRVSLQKVVKLKRVTRGWSETRVPRDFHQQLSPIRPPVPMATICDCTNCCRLRQSCLSSNLRKEVDGPGWWETPIAVKNRSLQPKVSV